MLRPGGRPRIDSRQGRSCIIARVRRFAALYEALDASTATGDKLAALKRYFADTE